MTDFAVGVATSLNETALFSLGQAGFIVKNKAGALLTVDPYLSECVERFEGHVGFKRLTPKILDPFDLEFNIVVATHAHFDHFDMDAVPQMTSNGRTRVFASLNVEREFERLMMKKNCASFVRPGDRFELDGFVLNFIRCDHGANAPDALGLILTVDGFKILFVGDSCLRLDWKEEYLSQGALDVMIAPINGKYGNLNEEEHALLCNALEPKLTIPCHFGTFASHGGDPGRFIEIMNKKYPKRPYLLTSLGEKLVLDGKN